jgi:hypothetical protein
MTNAYASVAAIKGSAALNITGTGYDSQLLALLEGVSRWIDAHCNRYFYVLTASRRFDGDGGTALAVPDLISITTLRTDENLDRTFEQTWATGDYLLYPLDAKPQEPAGRPFYRVLVDGSGSRRAFPPGQATVEITGKWGYREVLADSLADVAEGGVFSAADTTLTVTDGAKFAIGNTVLIEAEQLFVTAIAGNNLTVVRGVNGTTAVAHANGLDISIYQYPEGVVRACLLQAAQSWHHRGGSSPLAGGSRALAAESGLQREVRQLLAGYRRLPVGLGG